MKIIRLTQNQQTMVDDDVYEILNQFKWHAMYSKSTKTYYARRSVIISKGNYTTERLHWYIVGKPIKEYCIDHINGNSLDNRYCNLRIVTNRENQQNRKSHRNGRLVGCYYHKRDKKWISQIVLNGKQKCLGYFNTELEAHNRYKKELVKIRGSGDHR